MKSFSSFINEGKVPYRQMGSGMHGNFRYAPWQDGWGVGMTSSKPKPEKPMKPLSDYEQELIKKIARDQGQVGRSVEDIAGYDKNNKAKVKRTLENLVKRGALSKRTYKVTGTDVTKYFTISED